LLLAFNQQTNKKQQSGLEKTHGNTRKKLPSLRREYIWAWKGQHYVYAPFAGKWKMALDNCETL